MAKPSSITQWLSEPNSFTPADREDLEALLKAAPYFVPARYVQAAANHAQQPFNPEMMNTLQLYSGNWLMLYQYLDSCDIVPPTVETVPEVTETETEAETEQTAEPVQVVEPEVLQDVASESLPSLEVPGNNEAAILEEPVLSREPETEEAKPEPIEMSPIMETLPEITSMPEEMPPAEIHTGFDADPVPQPARKERKTEGGRTEEPFKPLFSEDYFLYQGIEVPEATQPEPEKPKEDKSLMVVMSFSEWLMHFKTRNEREKQELEDKKALKSMWQKEKLAAALEEENEEIPERVFNMAVNSITKEDDLVSESLAEILHRQGKYDKAIDMYRKLSLRNPQKSAYFASKIEQINKQSES